MPSALAQLAGRLTRQEHSFDKIRWAPLAHNPCENGERPVRGSVVGMLHHIRIPYLFRQAAEQTLEGSQLGDPRS